MGILLASLGGNSISHLYLALVLTDSWQDIVKDIIHALRGFHELHLQSSRTFWLPPVCPQLHATSLSEVSFMSIHLKSWSCLFPSLCVDVLNRSPPNQSCLNCAQKLWIWHRSSTAAGWKRLRTNCALKSCKANNDLLDTCRPQKSQSTLKVLVGRVQVIDSNN